MKHVDIIIPVHNRWKHTKQTLDSLFAHTERSLFKLYVVDDGSDEETALGLREHPERFELIKHVLPIGPGASRNQAARMITEKYGRGEYLYHSDNDVYFTRGWLGSMTAIFDSFEDQRLKVLGGSCHPYLQTSTRLAWNIIPPYPYTVGIKDAVSGYSQLMTWETWDKYGPFDESMRGAKEKIMGSEDWAFCQKIVKDGFKVGSIEPEVIIPCGKTNTYGKPATGIETFKDHTGVMVW